MQKVIETNKLANATLNELNNQVMCKEFLASDDKHSMIFGLVICSLVPSKRRAMRFVSSSCEWITTICVNKSNW